MHYCSTVGNLREGGKGAGADPGVFDWGCPNFGSERSVGLF